MTRKVILISTLALTNFVCHSAASGPSSNQIKNLVTFGDSYTDVVSVGDGGTAWPVYAARDGHFNLFSFAKSGATCSNNITSVPFPSVFESQLPLYFAEVSNGSIHLNPEETIYTLWIGTNDVGVRGLLTGEQAKGVSIVDTVSCAVNWIRVLYQAGARNFLFQNMIPLDRTILYSADSYPNRFWTAERNTTEWNVFMSELVAAGNELQKLMLQNLAPTLPGAHVGLFDSHGLISDIIAHPTIYLNGTAPINITGAVNSCIFQLNESDSDHGDCTVATGSDADSFLWFDELHPSEQTDRIVAREVAGSIHKTSTQWVTWFT